MKLKYITFTGADDYTNAAEMLALSQIFPQVEWGILLSPGRASAKKGTSRFPSHQWLHETGLMSHHTNANFAGHLCGQYVRDLLAGNIKEIGERRDDFAIFSRYQINFHGDPIGGSNNLELITLLLQRTFSLIFQMDGTNESVFHYLRSRGIQLFPLFDQSHGEGTLPTTWPDLVDGLCGFAGGLGPDNLEEELKKLEDHVGDREIWCDMETRIRNDQDQFDLDLVKRCIDIAAPYF